MGKVLGSYSNEAALHSSTQNQTTSVLLANGLGSQQNIE